MKPLLQLARFVVCPIEFHGLADLKLAAATQLAAYNADPFQNRVGSRASVFESEEMALKPSNTHRRS